MDMRKALPLLLAAVIAGCGGGYRGSSSSGFKLSTPQAGTIAVGKAVVTTNGGTGSLAPTETPDTGFLKNLPQPAGVSTGNSACASASSAPGRANLGSVAQSV